MHDAESTFSSPKQKIQEWISQPSTSSKCMEKFMLQATICSPHEESYSIYIYEVHKQVHPDIITHTYVTSTTNMKITFKKKVGCLWLYRYSPWFVWSWFFYKQIIHTSIKLYWFYMQPHIRIVCVLIKLNNFSCFTTSYVNKNSYTTKITLNKPILSTLLSLLIM